MSDVSIVLTITQLSDHHFLTLESVLKSTYKNLEVFLVHHKQTMDLDKISNFEMLFERVGHRLLVVESPNKDLISILNFGISL